VTTKVIDLENDGSSSTSTRKAIHRIREAARRPGNGRTNSSTNTPLELGRCLFDESRPLWQCVNVTDRLELKAQEPPLDHSDSCNCFQPRLDKPLLATPGAIERFGHETIVACLRVLQQKASEHNGIDYLQVFESADGDRLWFIEDGEGGAITALLPKEY
jgi:hypothetical protein